MDDLTITNLCAEAMGISFKVDIGPPYTRGAKRLMKEIEAAKRMEYDPLHDDAQAMALVKRLLLECQLMSVNDDTSWCWTVSPVDEYPAVHCSHHDLNRAICECVAKMQEAKHG